MSDDYSPAILIVDDVAENIKIVAGVLKSEGYKMAFATSGQAALAIAKNNSFDLVLLDVMMPEMDGFEVCTALKASPQTADSSVIFLTAKTDVDSIIRGFEVGGTDYVTKPFNASELSARVNTQIELKRRERQLQLTNAAKDRFISIIAQELKGPFVGLAGVLKMIDDGFDSIEPQIVRDYVSLSRKASDQLLGLIDNLLTWSTFQSESLPFAPRIVDLNSIISDVSRDASAMLNEKRIRLINHVEAGNFVYADESMVAIVVKNLLINASMFTREGGEVTISCKHEGDKIVLIIADTGIGMSADDVDNLFRIDKKVKTKGTAGEMGTGMGLILSRELIEKNDGKIWLQSELNKGTEVMFTLPCSTSHVHPVI